MTRGIPPLLALGEAEAIAQKRGDVVMLPGGRSDAFDLLICEEFRTVFVRVRRTKLRLMHLFEIMAQYHYDIVHLTRLPLTQVTAREFWVRLKGGRWQFFLVRHNGLFEIRKDWTYHALAELPVVTGKE